MEQNQAGIINNHLDKYPDSNQEDESPLLVDKNRQTFPRTPSAQDPDNGSEQGPLLSSSRQEPTSTSAVPQMRSPPLQTMSQPPNYDPNRIPLNIFSSKATNPQEWSVASNELFSIHMGNNSFSRDYEFLFGKSGELHRNEEWKAKSGELPRLEEWSNNNGNNVQGKSNEATNTLSPVKEDSHEENFPDSIEKKRNNVVEADPVPVINHPAPSTPTFIPAASVPEGKKSAPTPPSSSPATIPSPPRLSNESGHSGSSFAFPVLVKDGGKTTSGSLDAIPERVESSPRQQRQAQASKEATSGFGTRWCSFFSCWPQCC